MFPPPGWTRRPQACQWLLPLLSAWNAEILNEGMWLWMLLCRLSYSSARGSYSCTCALVLPGEQRGMRVWRGAARRGLGTAARGCYSCVRARGCCPSSSDDSIHRSSCATAGPTIGAGRRQGHRRRHRHAGHRQRGLLSSTQHLHTLLGPSPAQPSLTRCGGGVRACAALPLPVSRAAGITGGYRHLPILQPCMNGRRLFRLARHLPSMRLASASNEL